MFIYNKININFPPKKKKKVVKINQRLHILIACFTVLCRRFFFLVYQLQNSNMHTRMNTLLFGFKCFKKRFLEGNVSLLLVMLE